MFAAPSMEYTPGAINVAENPLGGTSGTSGMLGHKESDE